jgi:hypothetical protein
MSKTLGIVALFVSLVICLLSGSAAAQEASAFATDSCTWEPQEVRGGWGTTNVTAAVCEQNAISWQESSPEERVIYIGAVDDQDLVSLQPTDSCNCGDLVTKVGFVTEPHMDPICVISPPFSCSKPASGCVWMSYLKWYWEVPTASECRAMAEQCGTYYGYGGEEEASQTPVGECVCGETRMRWFFDLAPANSPSGYVGARCGAWRYHCWKPVWKPTEFKRYQEVLIPPVIRVPLNR